MIISPLTPLNFNSHKTDGIESDYLQTFYVTDRILIQIITSQIGIDYYPNCWLYDAVTRRSISNLYLNQWQINDKDLLYYHSLTLDPGYYFIYISGSCRSDVFRVTDDKRLLEDTTLIQYSMNNNRQRTDTVFFIDGMQYFFDWRVPGGFKDRDWTFGVESEQFVTQNGDISQLYGLATTQKKFTMGNSIGVPIWYGEMLNRVLTCSHVYFDGVKYTRKESSVPEMTTIADRVNSFIFSQSLQQSMYVDPILDEAHKLILRRTETDMRAVTNGSDTIIRETI